MHPVSEKWKNGAHFTLQMDNWNGKLPQNWKKEFLAKNPWFCEIPDDFIKDKFNLYGLDANYPKYLRNQIEGISKEDYSYYFNVCTNVIIGQQSLESISKSIIKHILHILPIVYGMIHARYIITPDGISQMVEKYSRHTFGVCPRINCDKEPLLPIGTSSYPGHSYVNGFCPCCRKVYVPRPMVELDGAYFGPNAAHIIIGHLKIVNKHMNYRKFEREAFGFKVAD